MSKTQMVKGVADCIIEDEVTAGKVNSGSRIREFSHDQRQYFLQQEADKVQKIMKIYKNSAQKKTINYINTRNPGPDQGEQSLRKDSTLGGDLPSDLEISGAVNSTLHQG